MGAFSAPAYHESIGISVGGLYAQSTQSGVATRTSSRAGDLVGGEKASLREFFAGLSAQPYVYTASPFPNRFLEGSQAELVLKVSKGGFPVANYPVTFASTIPVLLVPSHADDGSTNTSTSSNLDSLSKTNTNTNTAKASPNLDSSSADQRSQGGIAPDGEEQNIATEDEGQSIAVEDREENSSSGYARMFAQQTDARGEVRLTFFIEEAGEHVLTALFMDSRTGYTEHIEVFPYATVPSRSFQNYFLAPWIGLFLGVFVLVVFGGVFFVKPSARNAKSPSPVPFSARLSTLLAPLIPSCAIFYETSASMRKEIWSETKAGKDQLTEEELTEGEDKVPSEDARMLSQVETRLGLLLGIERLVTFLRAGALFQWIKDFRKTPVAFVLLLGILVAAWLILMASLRDQAWAPLLLGGLGLLVFVAFPRAQLTLAVLLTVALIQYGAARQFVSLAPLPDALVETMVSTPIMELSFGLLLLLQFLLPLPLPVGMLALSDYLFYDSPLQDELAWMTFVALFSMLSMLGISFRRS